MIPALIEQITLSKYHIAETLKYMRTKEYHKAYIQLKNVKTHITEAQKLMELNTKDKNER